MASLGVGRRKGDNMIVRWMNTFYNRISVECEVEDDDIDRIKRSIRHEIEGISSAEKSAELIKGSHSKALEEFGVVFVPLCIGILYRRNVLRKYYDRDIMSRLNRDGRKYPTKKTEMQCDECFIKKDSDEDIIGVLFVPVADIISAIENGYGNVFKDNIKDTIDNIVLVHSEIKEFCDNNGYPIIEKSLKF